jgi:hypothetical protein
VKPSVPAVIAALAVMTALWGCADYPDPGAVRPDGRYGAYYDGYYGPFYGGYWGAAGDFHYFDMAAMRYRRDRYHHFRRDAADGFRPVEASGPPEHRRPNRPRN